MIGRSIFKSKNIMKKSRPTLLEIITSEDTSDDIELVAIFDFDGTLIQTMEPEMGKMIYKEKTGMDFPYVGWWSKEESLNMDMFEFPVVKSVESIYRKHKSNPKCALVLMTNRIQKLENAVKRILSSNNMDFDHYSFATNNKENKGRRALQILKTHYPNTKNVEFYDDNQDNINSVASYLGTEYDCVCKLVTP